MGTVRQYRWEFVAFALTMALSVTGFWAIYFGARADPSPYHHLHIATVALWLGLLWYQLRLVDRRRPADHRRAGLAVLAVAPLLVASTTLLSVHSAHKGLVSGEGDFLIVQNVMTTIELAAIILAAFALRRRRRLHGALLASTSLLFFGIALFFTLISFVPRFEITGPETFDRFAKAAITGQVTCLAAGLLFLARDVRHGWPFLLAGGSFVLNEFIRSQLASRGLLAPLTQLVGSLDQRIAFVGSFALVLGLLLATGLLPSRRADAVVVP